MSQSTLTISKGLEDFIQLVLEDQVLQDRLQKAPDLESLVNLAVQLGAENGYDFTAEEVRHQLAVEVGQEEKCFPIEKILEIPVTVGY